MRAGSMPADRTAGVMCDQRILLAAIALRKHILSSCAASASRTPRRENAHIPDQQQDFAGRNDCRALQKPLARRAVFQVGSSSTCASKFVGNN
jgi:hypothetical protein